MKYYTKKQSAFITLLIVLSVLLMCFAGCSDNHSGNYNLSEQQDTAQPKYFLNIPDSPKVKAWLEVDYISNDTVYCNWYTHRITDNYQLRVNPNSNKTDIASYTLFDNDRIVGTFKDNTLDSIVVSDNQ